MGEAPETTTKTVAALLLPLIIVITALLGYLMTMPQTITLEDAGLFQMVCTQGGLSHPPGYPLFTMICQTALLSDDITAGNFISVFFAVATLVVFYTLAIHWFRPTIAATVALAYGFSLTFWHQSIIIEVYTLAVFLFYLDWLLLMRFVRTGDWRYWFAASLTFGLALSNHWPLSLLSAPALLAVVYPTLKQQFRVFFTAGHLIPALVLFLLGLSPYVTLLLSDDQAFGVFGPVTNTSDFVDYVSRSYYNDDHSGVGLQDKLHYLFWLVPEAARQFSYPLGAMALIGLLLLIKDRNSLVWPTLLNFLGATVGLTLLLGFNFDAHGQSVFRPYPIIAWGSLAIWIGYCLSAITRRIELKALRGTLALAAIVVVITANYSSANRSHEVWVETYFTELLAALPTDAVLFTDGDLLSFPLGYLHYVQGHRPDITLLNWSSLTYPNRLTPVTASQPDKEAAIVNFVSESDRPVFVIEPRLAPLTRYGWFNEVNRKDLAPTVILKEAEQMLDVVLTGYLNGTIRHQLDLELSDFILASFTRLYLVHQSHGHKLEDAQSGRFKLLLSTFPGKMMLLEHELQMDRAPDLPLLETVYQEALDQQPHYLARENRALLKDYGIRLQELSQTDTER